MCSVLLPSRLPLFLLLLTVWWWGVNGAPFKILGDNWSFGMWTLILLIKFRKISGNIYPNIPSRVGDLAQGCFHLPHYRKVPSVIPGTKKTKKQTNKCSFYSFSLSSFSEIPLRHWLVQSVGGSFQLFLSSTSFPHLLLPSPFFLFPLPLVYLFLKLVNPSWSDFKFLDNFFLPIQISLWTTLIHFSFQCFSFQVQNFF